MPFFAQLEGLSLACLVGLLRAAPALHEVGFPREGPGPSLKGPTCLSDTGPCGPLVQSGRDQWIADRPKWPRITPPLSDGYPTAIRRLSDGYPTVIRRLSDGIRRYPTPGPGRPSVLGAPAQYISRRSRAADPVWTVAFLRACRWPAWSGCGLHGPPDDPHYPTVG